ncbi:MAG: leucine-rich repeat domain-containing protein [Bacteroides sp.]|nr:leucine-rich repeat domain-containing protein [Bacteroides sp.]MCM1378562.1 leucine-rich repeat domain-containing protein [Bacteroides sp.]MCM1444863.1 leucine-rich repeat domain-containing protein [Prevotella sp.]
MNKIILTLISATAIFAASAREYGGTLGSNISWQLRDSILTVSGIGAMPSYTTTDWTRNPFMEERMAKGVRDIVIEEGITEIGAFSFGFRGNTQENTELYANLRSVTLPQSLRKIGHHAFTRIPVRVINIPDGVEDISAAAFANTGLRYVKLPASLMRIGPEAFLQCRNLIGVDLNHLDLALGTGVFFNCEQLQIVCHTENIRDIAPSTFDATRLTGSTAEYLLKYFKEDGLSYSLANGRSAADFYKSEAENLTTLFILDDFTLSPYDPESRTCRLQSVCHGDFILSLTPDQEQLLRTSLYKTVRECQPAFVPRKGRLIMQSLTLTLPDKTKLIAAPIQ